MTESAKASFNQKLRQKASGKAAEEKPNEELVERAGAALAELQEVIAELAGAAEEEGATK